MSTAIARRIREALKTAVVAALFGDRIKFAFRLFDMIARRRVDRRIESAVDDVFADDDQFAPHREIMDGTSVIGGIDDRGRLGGEAREILRDADAAEIVLAQKGLQRDGRRELARANQLRCNIKNAAVQFFGEILRLQKSETRSKASLLTRIAPRSACSASILCGGTR